MSMMPSKFSEKMSKLSYTEKNSKKSHEKSSCLTKKLRKQDLIQSLHVSLNNHKEKGNNLTKMLRCLGATKCDECLYHV